jgi:hypothetical protein
LAFLLILNWFIDCKPLKIRAKINIWPATDFR